MSAAKLRENLESGKRVLLIGNACVTNFTSFRIFLAGRASSNIATVINGHPITRDIPHEDFCSWQFCKLLEKGRAVIFTDDSIPYEPRISSLLSPSMKNNSEASFTYGQIISVAQNNNFAFNPNDKTAVRKNKHYKKISCPQLRTRYFCFIVIIFSSFCRP